MIDSRLITFITVATVKNFTKAGEFLNLTQPAVSQHIKFLEEHFGVKLIKKDHRQIDLTEEGEILFQYAKKLERISRILEGELKNKSSIVKRYNVGATMTIGGYILPYKLGKYKRISQNVDIILQVNNTEVIIHKLLNREIDLALVEGPFDKERFLYKKLKDDELVLVVSPSHGFARKEWVEMEEVLRGKLILREEGSGTRKIFENKLHALGYGQKDYKIYMEIGSINGIISLVTANLGYTIISKEVIKRELDLGILKIVPIRDVRILREFQFVYLNEGPMDFIDHFIHFCSMENMGNEE